jgi:hypothetical protein
MSTWPDGTKSISEATELDTARLIVLGMLRSDVPRWRRRPSFGQVGAFRDGYRQALEDVLESIRDAPFIYGILRGALDDGCSAQEAVERVAEET